MRCVWYTVYIIQRISKTEHFWSEIRMLFKIYIFWVFKIQRRKKKYFEVWNSNLIFCFVFPLYRNFELIFTKQNVLLINFLIVHFTSKSLNVENCTEKKVQTTEWCCWRTLQKKNVPTFKSNRKLILDIKNLPIYQHFQWEKNIKNVSYWITDSYSIGLLLWYHK